MRTPERYNCKNCAYSKPLNNGKEYVCLKPAQKKVYEIETINSRLCTAWKGPINTKKS